MIVLMADIVDSSRKSGNKLMNDFKEVVRQANKRHSKYIASPLTITLGDEFQGVLKTVEGAIAVIFDLDRQLMQLKTPFRLRYVINEGAIETPINKKIAYGMMGPGLTQARERLTSMKTSKSRISITLNDKHLAAQMSLAMSVYQGISDSWTLAQRKVVSVFWEEASDYRKAATKLKKDPTVMWRRKKSLMIEEIDNLKKLVFLMINPAWEA